MNNNEYSALKKKLEDQYDLRRKALEDEFQDDLRALERVRRLFVEQKEQKPVASQTTLALSTPSNGKFSKPGALKNTILEALKIMEGDFTRGELQGVIMRQNPAVKKLPKIAVIQTLNKLVDDKVLRVIQPPTKTSPTIFRKN